MKTPWRRFLNPSPQLTMTSCSSNMLIVCIPKKPMDFTVSAFFYKEVLHIEQVATEAVGKEAWEGKGLQLILAQSSKTRGWGAAHFADAAAKGFCRSNAFLQGAGFPPPSCGTGRQWHSPKQSSCTCSLLLPGQSVASLSAIFIKSQRHCRFFWQAGYLSPGDDRKRVSCSGTGYQQLPPCLLSVLPAW